jgi:uncharacterized damage-inducible protein DinB
MLRRLADYNRWANERLYAACAQLDVDGYYQARPSFFGSIHKTLNHLLVADRLWMARIAGTSPQGVQLDAELYRDRDALRAARVAQDEQLIDLMDGLDETALDRPIDYRTTSGKPFRNELALVLQHLFNHQTHHRGQVHDMLSATAVPPPVLDLIYYERQRSGAVI